MVNLSFMPRSMMGAALEGQKLVYRRHGGCVARVDPDLSAARSIDLLIGNVAPPSRHDGCARLVSLAANLPLFPGLPQYPLRKIEPLLGFCLLLLQVLETTFQCLEPRNDVGRW